VSRWSLKNVLRLTRGALNATARAGIKYRKDAEVDFRLVLVRRSLREAEKQLRFALRDAIAKATPAEKRRRAA
jgi:hypothetical protein